MSYVNLGVRILRYPQWKHIWIGKIAFCCCFVQYMISIHWQEIKDISHAVLINVILIIAIKFMLNDFTKVAANLSLAANIIFCACNCK